MLLKTVTVKDNHIAHSAVVIKSNHLVHCALVGEYFWTNGNNVISASGAGEGGEHWEPGDWGDQPQ